MCRRWEAAVGDEIRWQVVMPGTLRKAFVKQVHGGITGGHLGRDKTEEQVVRRAYWPGWKQDVAKALRECAQCTQYHRGLPPRQVQLKPLVAGSPWERMSIDVTGFAPPFSKRASVHPYTRRPFLEVGGSLRYTQTYGSSNRKDLGHSSVRAIRVPRPDTFRSGP